MNKQELIRSVAESTGVSIKQTGETLNQVLETITDTLSTGESVSLIGFGKFESSPRAERNGINPTTGASITIAARNAATFKAGAGLKSAVNGK